MPVTPVIVPDWPAPDRVRAASTERTGDLSGGPYAGGNFGAHVGDDPAAVAGNRAALVEALGITATPVWLEQVHGTTVLDLDAWEYGGGGPAEPVADGAVTSKPGQACVVMSADCLPVLLCDRSGARVGVAHAGWRGLANGVVASAVGGMGVAPASLLAWLGPAIGRDAYEVGEEVRSVFVDADPAAASCFVSNANGRWQADLYGLAGRSLAAAGVPAIYGGGFCTYTESDRFFSHRREAPCGRMATLIWLDP